MKMHVEISCCGWHFQSFDGIRSIPSLSLTTKFAEILFKLRLVVILENVCHVWSLLRLIDFKIKNKFLSDDQCVISEENCLHCCGGGNAASFFRDAQRFSANCAKYIT